MSQVSIILPVHNGGRDLPAAVQSVFGQSLADWELIIVNDGSTDNTSGIISQLQNRDSRVALISHPQNLGLVKSLNDAVAAARGEFLARLDADDIWIDREKLAGQVLFLEQHPDCNLVGTWARVANTPGKKLYDFRPPCLDIKIRKEILLHNCFVHSSAVVRKKALLKAGGYRTEDLHVEDYALWLRLGLMGELANLPEVMVEYRFNEQGITKTKNRFQILANLRLIKQYRGFYPNYFWASLKWRLQLWGAGPVFRRFKNRPSLL